MAKLRCCRDFLCHTQTVELDDSTLAIKAHSVLKVRFVLKANLPTLFFCTTKVP
ncbi:hypothetical protein SPWS13_2964 [Shewanella putrefaciens]|nr:hypothetical protein SPWS13_2964 [Shewanella putrefaciens]